MLGSSYSMLQPDDTCIKSTTSTYPDLIPVAGTGIAHSASKPATGQVDVCCTAAECTSAVPCSWADSLVSPSLIVASLTAPSLKTA